MTNSRTIEVGGQKIRTRTNRRYVVVAYRADDFRAPDGVYVRFARVEKRSDSIVTALREASREEQRRGWPNFGVQFAVVDTTTGVEVSR